MNLQNPTRMGTRLLAPWAILGFFTNVAFGRLFHEADSDWKRREEDST